MHRFVRSVRCAGIASVGCFTLLAGAVLVWLLIRPEMLPMLSTWHLAAILSSFVLPALCLAIWQADRRTTARLPRRTPSVATYGSTTSVSALVSAPRAVNTAKPASEVSSEASRAALPQFQSASSNQKVQAVQLSSARTDAMAIRRSSDSRRIHRHRRSVRV